MSTQILDGSGSGYAAKVNSLNRLETFSIIENRVADVSKRTGLSFVLASDFISLTTTGSFNGIMYVKNESDKYDLYIDKVRTCSDIMGNVQIRILRNPTAGTLVSDANLADQLSANVGKEEPFDGLAYSASGDGKTVTDGENFSQFINHSPGHSIQEYDGAVIIPRGKSIAMVAKPSVAMTLCAEIQCWFEEA